MLRKVPSVRIEGGRARLAADRSQPSPPSPARTLVTHDGTLRSAELCRAAVAHQLTRRKGVVVARFADGRSVDGVFPGNCRRAVGYCAPPSAGVAGLSQACVLVAA